MVIKNSPRCVLILGPSFAFADQIAPLIDLIAKENKVLNLKVILPSPQIALEFDQAWFPARKIEQYTAEAVFRTYSGEWLSCGSLEEAARSARAISIVGRLRRKVNLLGLAWVEKILIYLEQNLLARKGLTPLSIENPTISPGSLVFFDLTEVRKPYFGDLLSSVSESKCIAIMHGLGFLNPNKEEKWAHENERIERIVKSTVVFSQSTSETLYYSEVVGVPYKNIRKTGVLRHDSGWLSQLCGPSERHGKPGREFLLLVSRPIGPWLPWWRKFQNLRALKSAARRHGLQIMVKRHPKERRDGSLIAGLGIPWKTSGWALSKSHLLNLAWRSEFAVAFDSGACLDFLRIGLPTIQLLNLSGLSNVADAENNGSDTQPVSPYVKAGVVLHATDKRSLLHAIVELQNDRETWLARMEKNFRSEFFPTLDVEEIGSIVREI